MKVRLHVSPTNEWAFRADPEPPERPESLFDPEGGRGLPGVLGRILGRFGRRLGAEYHHMRRAIEETERLRWIRNLIRWLEARSDPSEPLLRGLRGASEVDLYYPASLSAALVRRRFLRFLRRRYRAHTRGIVINLVLLPVTAALAILPGPNVFFGWNAYRLIAHYLARQGARRVMRGECPMRLHPVAEEGAVVA